MGERSFVALQDIHEMATGQSKKRFRVLETTFTAEDNEDVDSPEELLLPSEHPALKDGSIRKWLSTTSTAALSEDECDERQCVATKDTGLFSRVKVTSGCICKLLVVLYLLACLLVSTLYIAIYGPNELYLVPETSPQSLVKPTPTPVPLSQFYDNLYTEWISQRWTYDTDLFADWPSLPEYISSLQQTASGEIDSRRGVWLLDTQGLYFMYGVGLESDDVSFVNISENLDLSIHEGARVCVKTLSSLYVLSPDDITLLDCSPSSEDYCDVSSHWPTTDLSSISSAVVSDSTGDVWIGTDQGLYRLNTTPPSPLFGTVEGVISDEAMFVADDLNGTNSPLLLMTEVEGPILSLAWRGPLEGPKGWGLQGHAFLFTNSSRYYHQNVSFNNGADRYIGGATSYPDDFGLLVVGTPSRLYFYDGHMFWFEWVSAQENGVGGVVDGSPLALTFVPTGELFVGSEVSLSRLNIDYTFDQIGGLEGLPYNHILALRYSPFSPRIPLPLKPQFSHKRSSHGTLWIGTEKGYSLFDIGNSRFVGYFYGPRWHSGESILGISGVDCKDRTVLLTDEGITIVAAEQWTLEKKAHYFQEMLTQHVREPGLVADCPLSEFIPSSCSPSHTDNDGLWTSWLVAAEAFRYKVTGSKEARRNGWKFYQAMKFLVDVTGVEGLPASTIIRTNISCRSDDEYGESGLGEESTANDCDDNVLSQIPGLSGNSSYWHRSTTKPGWVWKGNASSDEIVGHIFASTIAYDLLAQSLGEKQEVADTLDSIIGYIKYNNYTLMDVGDTPTQGVWEPPSINLNQSWAEQRGLNALQILSGLLSAYRITGKTEYFEAWQELFNGSYNSEPAHYGLNIINQATLPHNSERSNNELAFLPYFVYFQTLKHLRNSEVQLNNAHQFNGKEIMLIPMLSLNKAWRTVRGEKSAAWHSIYGNITGDDSLTEDIAWSLRNWPLELVQWRTNNSHRLDIKLRRRYDSCRLHHGSSQSVEVLSPRERTQLRWSTNPYLLDSSGSSSEVDPGPWLMSYWLARWTSLL